jgi:hypothetical protein
VIPIVLAAAALVGRWWFVPLAAVAWASLIVMSNADPDVELFLGAAGFAAANAVVGVVFHKAAVSLVRKVIPASRATARR